MKEIVERGKHEELIELNSYTNACMICNNCNAAIVIFDNAMILLSFDTEEFDVPREHGVRLSVG